MSRPLKIGLVFDDSLDSNDGVQQYVKTLGRWLISQGHEVRFLVGETTKAGEFQQYVYSLSKNIRVSGNQNKMFLPLTSSSKKIKAVLEAEQFDVLHIMMPFNPLMGSRVIRRSGDTAVVATFHMVGGTRLINLGAKVLSVLQRSTLQRVDTYLSVSTAAQTFERDHFRIESQVSPNMVDIEPFQAGTSRQFLRGEKMTLLFLGRLVERKGARYLLEALRALHQQQMLEGVRVNICGDGELRGELEQYVADHQLSDSVIFHGFINEDEKADYLASADIAIYPSIGGEAFGIVLIEAMAAGKAVVLGGDNPGYRTVLGERDELLFAPKDPNALARKIELFMRSPERRKAAIKWQSTEVRKYDVGTVGVQVVAHYRSTIAKKH